MKNSVHPNENTHICLTFVGWVFRRGTRLETEVSNLGLISQQMPIQSWAIAELKINA